MQLRKPLLPSMAILVIAFLLSFLVAISLPPFRAMDIVRITFKPDLPRIEGLYQQFRLGIWGFCQYEEKGGDADCPRPGAGYAFGVLVVDRDQKVVETVSFGPSWTRGLVVHTIVTPIVAAAAGLAFTNSGATLVLSCIVAFFAAFMTLLAFIIDIALLVHVKRLLGDFDHLDVSGGPGFWLTLTTLILVILGGVAVFLGQRVAGLTPKEDTLPMRLLGKIPFVKKNEWA